MMQPYGNQQTNEATIDSNDSGTMRCFDCGRDVPIDQTVEFEYDGPETVPNPKMVRVCLECWNAAKEPGGPLRALVAPPRCYTCLISKRLFDSGTSALISAGHREAIRARDVRHR